MSEYQLGFISPAATPVRQINIADAKWTNQPALIRGALAVDGIRSWLKVDMKLQYEYETIFCIFYSQNQQCNATAQPAQCHA